MPGEDNSKIEKLLNSLKEANDKLHEESTRRQKSNNRNNSLFSFGHELLFKNSSKFEIENESEKMWKSVIKELKEDILVLVTNNPNWVVVTYKEYNHL